MTPAHAIALVALPVLAVAAAFAASVWATVRDVLFFAMLSLAVLAERMQVNFLSAAWYRGTTRGLQFTVLEVLAFGLLIGCWLGRPRGEPSLRWPASLGLMLAGLVYAGLSVLASQPRLFGGFELTKLAAGILVFAAAAGYARSRREWTLGLVAVGLAVALEGGWSLEQHFVTRLARVEGSLDHANSLSMYLCLTLPLLIAGACAGWSRALRWFCGAAAGLGSAGLLLTFSRTGLPVFAVVATGTVLTCASWRLSLGRVALVGLIGAVAVAAVIACWGQIAGRYGESTLEEEYLDPTQAGRGIYLRLADAIARDHFFGVGLNNWSYQVSRTYGPRLGFDYSGYDELVAIYGTGDDKLYADAYLAPPAHNLAALTLGELGVPGLGLAALLWLRWFGLGAGLLRLPRRDPMHTMGAGIFFGIVGVFGQSLTEWVYRQTPIFLTFQILVGVLAGVVAARRRERVAAGSGPAPAALAGTWPGRARAVAGA